MSRLSIEIDPEEHRRIKMLATDSGMSMKEFILSKVLGSEDNVDATEQLLSTPENKKRLLEAIGAPTEESLAFDRIEDLKNALGI